MDENTDRFLRMLCDLAISHCLTSAETAAAAGARAGGGQGAGADGTFLSFMATDGLVRLMVSKLAAPRPRTPESHRPATPRP